MQRIKETEVFVPRCLAENLFQSQFVYKEWFHKTVFFTITIVCTPYSNKDESKMVSASYPPLSIAMLN